MRVAYVCADPGVPAFGSRGSSVHLQEVVRGLGRAGAQVTLFVARPGEEPRPPDLQAVKLVPLPPLPKGDPAPREQAALANNAALRRALTAHGPFDLVYERYSLWSHAGMAFARAAGVPGVLEVNAPLLLEQRAHRTLVDAEAAGRVAHSVFAAATALIAVSPGVAHYLEAFSEARGRVHVLPNGVDPDRFAPSSRDVRAQRLRVGFAGTLKPWHGVATLVEAVARLRAQGHDLELRIVGDGPERPALAKAAVDAGLGPHIVFAGMVPYPRMPDELARFDVAVAPYPPLDRFYFSPLKIFEYMAAALPIIASRIGDLPNVVREGQTGLLVPPSDPVALAAAIAKLARDPTRARRMGQAGRRLVIERHSWRQVVGRILDIAGIRQATARPRSA